ncbi:MAG: GcrA family cell cycle regulator [Alphaproteobacteria bacterium]
MTWTEQKIQMLRDMWGNGFSASDIAKRLGGLTRNAVIGKAHRLKLSGRPSPIRREDETAPKATGMVRARAPKKIMMRPGPSMPPPPPPAPVAIVKRSAEAMKSAVAPIKTTERQCRWPYGDPRSQDFKFCGCHTVEGLPYCPDHARAAYQNFGRGRGKRDEAQTSLPSA